MREVQELVALRSDPRGECADIRASATAKLNDVNAKIRQVDRVQRARETLIAARTGKSAVESCSILEEVARN